MCSRVNVFIVAGSDHGTVRSTYIHTYAVLLLLLYLRGMYSVCMRMPEA